MFFSIFFVFGKKEKKKKKIRHDSNHLSLKERVNEKKKRAEERKTEKKINFRIFDFYLFIHRYSDIILIAGKELFLMEKTKSVVLQKIQLLEYLFRKIRKKKKNSP